MNKRALKSADMSPGKDICQTPAYALDPLLPYLSGVIWECAEGEGYLTRGLQERGLDVIGTDIVTGYDFLDERLHSVADIIVTNPPFSLKYKFLERCYRLGKPFALLMPVDVIGTKTAQALFKEHGVEILLLDKRINFKMPNKGWAGTAWFATAWFCYNLLPEQIVYGRITRDE